MIVCGDALTVLPTLPERSVQMCATSPPYWGLRDYGLLPQNWPAVDFSPMPGLPVVSIPAQEVCLGLEPDPWAFVGHLVLVFREVRRVLRDDGVLFLNLGDSYAGGGRAGKNPDYQARHTMFGKAAKHAETFGVPMGIPAGLKAKDLCGVPWRVAFALQADGWFLRSDIVWSKNNPMPSSCTDRPTVCHEYVFLLSKSPRYFWDQFAIREGDSGKSSGNGFAGRQGGSERVGPQSGGGGRAEPWTPTGSRNARSVWEVNTQPFKEAHFATFPEALVERMIFAGTSECGCCLTCWAPLKRIVDAPQPPRSGGVNPNIRDGGLTAEHGMERTGLSHFKLDEWRRDNPPRTVGWEPTCPCNAGQKPCVVLDPFGGSGTTAQVSRSLGRDSILIEPNPSYVQLAEDRYWTPTRKEKVMGVTAEFLDRIRRSA